MNRKIARISHLVRSAVALSLFFGAANSHLRAQNTAGLIRYDQGDPTDEEQYLLQQLNGARLDPAGEGQRLAAWLRGNADGRAVIAGYGINPDQVVADFATLPVVPPLAFDPHLLAAAAAHSADFAAHGGDGPGGDDHTGYDGSSPLSRVKASGYKQGYYGENVACGLTSLDEIHAGFLIDWGNPDLSHRRQSMNGTNAMNLVGVGVTTASSNSLVETEEYGMPNLTPIGGKLSNADVPALLTGVAYNDANNNGQYDLGEGVAGVTVTMDAGSYYAVTSKSGGYALPLVNADGSNVDGAVSVRMIFPGGDNTSGVVSIARFFTSYGSYRGNIEWDGLSNGGSPKNSSSDPSNQIANPNLPHFASATGSTLVVAGGLVKIKVFRPDNSDINNPYNFSYKTKGTAVAGVDYVELPRVGIIAAGKTNAKIKVQAMANVENSHTLKLKLTGVTILGTLNLTIMP